MKVGEVLNGYEIETAPTNSGGGMSQWSFARKDGQQYFVKMFLAPKFPLPDGPGSEASKARKRAACLAFERRHLDIAGRLDPNEPGSGNLVVPCDFFRVDSTYVKVMERIDATRLPPANRLTGQQLLVIVRTLLFSLRLLHDKQVVHADVKPDNVLLKENSPGVYVSKLIDFDEAYVVGQPPDPEHIVGDPLYYAPELLRYIKRDETLPSDALSTAADVFSLALLLHAFLVGDVPGFGRELANYPAESLLIGGPLDLSAAPTVLQPVLARMLALRPDARPTVPDIIDFFGDVDPAALVPTAQIRRERPTRPRQPAPRPATPSHPAPPTGVRTPRDEGGVTTISGVRRTLRAAPARRSAPDRPIGESESTPESEPTPGIRSTMGRRGGRG